MMNEMKEILNEGGAPKMTTYAVEIGSPLWVALYSHVNETHKIVAVCTEEDQTFAVLQNREDESYSRMNFSFNEEVFAAEEMTVLESYEPAEEPQFALDAVEAFEAEFKKEPEKKEDDEDEEKKDDEEEKCPKCGKPLSECECEEETEDEDKKKKYTLEEIPEYVELLEKYSALETQYNELVEAKAAQDATIASLTEYKVAAERKEKEEMINNQFYMLSDDLKADVVENIDTYSLDEIESKLSLICVRNKINFNLDDDKNPGTDPMTYNLNGSSMEDDAVPAWIKAVMATAKTLN